MRKGFFIPKHIQPSRVHSSTVYRFKYYMFPFLVDDTTKIVIIVVSVVCGVGIIGGGLIGFK